MKANLAIDPSWNPDAIRMPSVCRIEGCGQLTTRPTRLCNDCFAQMETWAKERKLRIVIERGPGQRIAAARMLLSAALEYSWILELAFVIAGLSYFGLVIAGGH